MENIIYLLYFALGLGFLIFIHEGGHFLMAKLNGIRVERFSIGFGPKLFAFKKGETEYCISLLFFLGGYVKMTGQNDLPVDVPEDEKHDPKSFENKSVLARLGVVLGGPVVNLLFAFLITPFIFMFGMEQPKFIRETPLLLGVASGSSAEQAGLKKGDQILSVNGKLTSNWEALFGELAFETKKKVKLKYKRDSQEFDSELYVSVSQRDERMPSVGIHPHRFLAPVIGGVEGPAKQAGLLSGDQILSINGQEIEYFNQIGPTLQKIADQRIVVKVLRKTESKEFAFNARKDQEGEKVFYRMGVRPRVEMVKRQYGFIEAWKQGIQEQAHLYSTSFRTLKKLFTFQLELKSLTGIVGITQLSMRSARSGFGDFLWFLALLSLQLGIMNLLPLPVLDGGHVVYLIYEAIVRKPVPMNLRVKLQVASMALLLFVMVYVTYFDISRWIK